jgi:hypothetical protein
MTEARARLNNKFVFRAAPGTANNAGTTRGILYPRCGHFLGVKFLATDAAARWPFPIIPFCNSIHTQSCFSASHLRRPGEKVPERPTADESQNRPAWEKSRGTIRGSGSGLCCNTRANRCSAPLCSFAARDTCIFPGFKMTGNAQQQQRQHHNTARQQKLSNGNRDTNAGNQQ